MGKLINELNIRDVEVELFHYLFESKIATSAQLRRDIYKGISHQALYKRMNLLEREKWIEAWSLKQLKRMNIYSLSPKGFREYISSGKKMRMQRKSDSVYHDLDLVDIRYAFSKSPMVETYFTENLIRSQSEFSKIEGLDYYCAFNPDALACVRLKNGSYKLPVEYERTLKFNQRGISFFRRYYFDKNIPAIILICKDEELAKKIKSRERQVIGKDQKPKFFYSTLDALLKENDLSFTNLDGKIINLNPVAPANCKSALVCNSGAISNSGLNT